MGINDDHCKPAKPQVLSAVNVDIPYIERWPGTNEKAKETACAGKGERYIKTYLTRFVYANIVEINWVLLYLQSNFTNLYN